jgi:hypothetical protein
MKVKFDALNDEKNPAMESWTDSLNLGAEWEKMSAWRTHKNPMTEGSADMQIVIDKLVDLARTFSLEGLIDQL